jgi:hypothetical protein
MQKHQYVNALGQVVDEADAIDAHGLLRQGMGVRTILQLADAAPDDDSYFAHRVGYCISDAPRAGAAHDERMQAYDEMVERTQNAYRNPPAQTQIVSDTRASVRAAAPTTVADAQAVRDAAWVDYCRRLENAWRSPA